jgi:hypothetical protein
LLQAAYCKARSDVIMSAPAPNVSATKASARGRPRGWFALWGSYAADLRGWVGRLAAGYGIAAALMVGGVLAVFAAIAVGMVALFHFIELRYGANIAFAALGSALLVLGATLLLAGWLVMKRKAAPLPRPHEQFRAARQMLLGSTISRAVTALRENEAARPDATTRILLGAAAIVAVGWIVVTHGGTGRQVRR